MSKVKLYKYQEEAFNNTMEIYKSSDRACVIMATGTGKSYIMMRLLEEFDRVDGKAYILTPNNPTKKQTIDKMIEYDLNNAEFGLYQTINAMTDEEIARIDCDLIIADELHRTGATQWGKKFEHLINTHPNAKVFGVTATPIRSDGRDMAEEYFEGNKACEISLSDAIVREILPMPLYVSALYTFEEEYQNMSDKIEKGNNSVEEKVELQKELFAAKQQLEKANGVPEIIKKYITNYNGKYIVFCKNKTHMKKMKGTVKKWFKQADYNGKIFSYEYYSEDKYADENFNNFQNNNQEGLKLLFVIDMLNEGLHLKDINGCILLRTTGSHIVYYQQIGRVIDADSKEQRVILDLVSNFNSLKSFNLEKELKESVKKRQLGNFSDCSEEFELDKFDVVDCVQVCIDVFNNIDAKIIGNCNDWTVEEEKELIKLYPIYGLKKTAKLLERSESSVSHKANRLGLLFNVLSDDDKRIILENYEKHGLTYIKNNFYIAASKKVIDDFAKANNLVNGKQRKWTKEEDEVLISLYGNDNMFELMEKLDRTKSAIQSRAYVLGLTYKSKSKYKYVRNVKGKYYVSMTINGKKKHLGVFQNEDEAGMFALEKAKEYGKI